MIQEINKVFVVNDTIVVGDFKQARILLFNFQGKYLSSFSNSGKGPTEYVKIRDIALEPITNNILILDSGSGKIKRYSLSGKFEGAIGLKRENYGDQFIALNNELLFFRNFRRLGEGVDNLIVTDRAHNRLNSGIKIPGQIENFAFSQEKIMDRVGDSLYVMAAFNDTIFLINNKLEIKTKAILDFPRHLDIKKTRYWKKKYPNSVEFHNNAISKGMVFGFGEFIVLNQNILFKYYGGGSSYVHFDIGSNKTYLYNDLVYSPFELGIKILGKSPGLIISQLRVPTQNNERYTSFLESKGITEGIGHNPVLIFFDLL